MKTKSFSLFLAVFFSFCIASAYGFQDPKPQDPKQPDVKVSPDELKALNAINALTDPPAKIKAISDYMMKYSKTPPEIRQQLADISASEIVKIKDPAQAIAAAESVQPLFTADAEQEPILLSLLDTYVTAGRADDAFRVGAAILAKNPDEVHTHAQLTFMGASEVKKQNPKFVKTASQSAMKAIELIEADKKPARMDPAIWTSHKALLPQIYQQSAVLSLVSENVADARTRATKATQLAPTDPTNFALLGMVINNDYLSLANSYKTMPEGADKAATLKKLEGIIDEIIDAYAHAVALSVGKPEHQGMMQQLTVDLTSYYKYRHNNSTDGLQQLIDKYKPKP